MNPLDYLRSHIRSMEPYTPILPFEVLSENLGIPADQIINHLSKFRWMYNEQVQAPVVIRAPMGGGRGYGPTHSQTLEKHFLGTPGLRVIAPCALGDPEALLFEAILSNDDPTLFIENKLLYLQAVDDESKLSEFSVETIDSGRGYAPTFRLRIEGAPKPDLTLSAYGYMGEIARQAAVKLAYEHELFVELIIPTLLSPFEVDILLESADGTGRLLVVEEGGLSMGWSAEVIALVSEALGPRLSNVKRVAARDLPIPASRPLENAVLPTFEEIIQAAQKMV